MVLTGKLGKVMWNWISQPPEHGYYGLYMAFPSTRDKSTPLRRLIDGAAEATNRVY